MIQTIIHPCIPPYRVVYCNGQVALHVATLITVEIQEEKNRKGFITQSHPVVSYHNPYHKAESISNKHDEDLKDNIYPQEEGIVWADVELKDLKPLCYADADVVPLERIRRLYYDIMADAFLENDDSPDYDFWRLLLGSLFCPFSLSNLSSQLDSLGIRIGLPSKEEIERNYRLEYNLFQRYLGFRNKYFEVATWVEPNDDIDVVVDSLSRQLQQYESIFPREWNFRFHFEYDDSYSDKLPYNSSFYQQVVVRLNNQVRETLSNSCKGKPKKLQMEIITTAIKQCQCYFWAQSSWAVIYCVLRDYFNGDSNVSKFEREMGNLVREMSFKYPCKKDTVGSTLRNNAYMQKSIKSWTNKRALKLVEEFKSAMKSLL